MMALCLTGAMVGCSPKDLVEKTVSEIKDEPADEKEGEELETKEEEKKKVSGVVLGSDEAEGYDEYYATDCKDLQISEIEEIGDNAVRATANYVEYDKYEDVYRPVYCTYYVVELEEGLKVMVEVEMNLEEVTGKTDALIDEIESFYQFEIDWDKAAAETRIEEFAANDTSDSTSFSTGYLLFDLPKGWDEDYSFDSYAYAPDGDYEFAECYITIDREYNDEAELTIDSWLIDLDLSK